MRLEKMIQRLAEKTNTPLLEQVLLGEKTMHDLPDDCMIWTGANRGSQPFRLKKTRDANNIPYLTVNRDRPYGIVCWQGDNISVHRLIFQLMEKPNYEYRMLCQCGTPLCVNPLHFSIKEVQQHTPAVPEIEIADSEEWSPEEVDEMLEIFLTENNPKGWDDVVSHPLLLDIPEDMLRQGLRDLNKGHLT